VTSWIKKQQETAPFFGSNSSWLESWYDDYLKNPEQVPTELRKVFDALTDNTATDVRHLPVLERMEQAASFPPPAPCQQTPEQQEKQAAVLRLVNAYRVRGHQKAQLDPLGYSHRPAVPDLDPAFHKLTEADMNTVFNTGSMVAPDQMKLKDIIALLEKVYCHHIGVEYMHLTDTRQREWLQQRLEGPAGRLPITDEQKVRLLEELTKAEGLEKYLHTKYVGQKRFSLEGLDALVPQIRELARHLAANGAKELVIGMAHRGRLNVLVNILGKSPQELFEEFEGKHDNLDDFYSGDVKYHMGFSSDMPTEGGTIHLALAFNPSHLEAVDPVVAGSTRARQTRRKDESHRQVVPLLIHGDSAIEGQGVVMELLNMSQEEDFTIGGTIHIVTNNQIGFTTPHPLDEHAPVYCTEVTKTVQAPIFHVNADDPEAVVFVTNLAADFRNEFGKDVVIDLVGYRRHGHNEADEPAATQPRMYKLIKQHPTARAIYAAELETEGVIEPGTDKKMADAYRQRLDEGQPVVEVITEKFDDAFVVDWSPFRNGDLSQQVKTAIDPERVAPLGQAITTIPDGFKLHPRVRKIMDDRVKMAAGELPMDWGFAETMAYASLLEDGYQVRLDGQDSQRGTFFHRHAVLHDVETDDTYMPLQKLASPDNPVNIIDSVLSEEAVMAYEYGYATSEPNALVIWEAQFGDFANGAQVVVDQFISSGEAKWGRMSGLTLFLPHGYEGQGPEHSSARLERYLQLCAVKNMQVCVPTTPAQMFHLLRRQMLRNVRKPLVVLTPKSLLRHKKATSDLALLSNGRFQEIIPDRRTQPDNVKRVVLCSGKVYYDLLETLEQEPRDDIAVIRIEQLYPFPRPLLKDLLEQYTQLRDVVWCQEEPMNQGAWFQIRHHLQHCINDRVPLYYAGRPGSPAPAVGSFKVHVQQQKQLVQDALTGEKGTSIDSE